MPDLLTKINRRVKSRRLKVLGAETMRRLGMRQMVIRIDTTNLCNLRCLMCYYSADSNRKRADMDAGLFQKIAREVFPRTRFLYLSCATEPLMNKRFSEFVRIAGQYKVPFTSFCTNGMLLNEDVVEACIEARISEIIFSVDGATAGTYELIRRGGKFDRLEEKLDLLASVKKRGGSDWPAGRINFTCLRTNIDELPAMIRFAAKHGIYQVHVRHLLAYQDEDNTCKAEMRYVKVFDSVAAEARAEAKRLNVTLFLPDPVAKTDLVGVKQSAASDSRAEANPHCLLPWVQGIINWAGDYRICSVHPPIGNLGESTFEEIYHSARLRTIRQRMLRLSADSCSWDCHQEAYDVPAVEEDEEPGPLVSIGADR